MAAERVDQVPVGQRVTLRRRLPDGTAADVVGTVLAHDADGVTLHTMRRGEVRVPYAEVVVHRVVRPVPWRIGAFLRRAGVAVLDLDGVLRTGGDPTRAEAVGPAVALVDSLLRAGTPTFLLTDGTEGVAEELGHAGLDRPVPVLLDTRDLGCATPAPDAWRLAHAEIERRLGRAVARGEVHFTDDRPGHVEAARDFGWQGRVFTPPAPGQW